MAGIFGRIHPAALVEAENMHLGVGETPGHRRAGGTGANDQDVNGIVHSSSFFSYVIASEAKQSILSFRGSMDCFVATLLAMTA
jgi:hypothetical protein